MDFKTLEHFIKKKMKMTHIYQPLMIRTLLSSNNTATVEDIARAFVNSDPSQLEYYKQIAKRWPHITLRKHNVIKYDKGVYTLLAENITRKQKQMLIELCELRLQNSSRNLSNTRSTRKYQMVSQNLQNCARKMELHMHLSFASMQGI